MMFETKMKRKEIIQGDLYVVSKRVSAHNSDCFLVKAERPVRVYRPYRKASLTEIPAAILADKTELRRLKGKTWTIECKKIRLKCANRAEDPENEFNPMIELVEDSSDSPIFVPINWFKAPWAVTEKELVDEKLAQERSSWEYQKKARFMKKCAELFKNLGFDCKTYGSSIELSLEAAEKLLALIPKTASFAARLTV